MKKAMSFARYVGGMLMMAFALSSAQATTINFTGAAEGGVYTNPTNSGNGPSQYTSQGYKFLATGADGHFHENMTFADSVYMHSNSGTVTINTWVLSAVTNSLFDVVSFTMDSGAYNWVSNLGTKGTTIVGLNNVGLKGISSLTFSLVNTSSAGSLDKFVVNASAVPEPETGALFVAGLGMLAFVARRRKQTAAA